ncbi:MAG: hypothetical protein ACI9A1_001965, partial [Lentimonas sp.]
MFGLHCAREYQLVGTVKATIIHTNTCGTMSNPGSSSACANLKVQTVYI